MEHPHYIYPITSNTISATHPVSQWVSTGRYNLTDELTSTICWVPVNGNNNQFSNEHLCMVDRDEYFMNDSSAYNRELHHGIHDCCHHCNHVAEQENQLLHNVQCHHRCDCACHDWMTRFDPHSYYLNYISQNTHEDYDTTAPIPQPGMVNQNAPTNMIKQFIRNANTNHYFNSNAYPCVSNTRGQMVMETPMSSELKDVLDYRYKLVEINGSDY